MTILQHRCNVTNAIHDLANLRVGCPYRAATGTSLFYPIYGYHRDAPLGVFALFIRVFYFSAVLFTSLVV